MFYLAMYICACEIKGERTRSISDPAEEGSLLVAAMRYTVKPSMVGSVAEDFDDDTANFDCRVPDPSGTDSGHPTEDSYLSTSMLVNSERSTLLPKSPLYEIADNFELNGSEPAPIGSAENLSDLDGAINSQPFSTLLVDLPESASKRDFCVGAETLSLADTSIHPGAQRSLADRGRKFASRQKRRLVFKDGSCNISSRNVMSRKRMYLVDIFTTMVDMRWRYSVLMFTAAFVVSWFAFSVIWYLIAYIHGDTEHADDDDWKSCAAHVYDYPTALLFSIETQTTIGYG